MELEVLGNDDIESEVLEDDGVLIGGLGEWLECNRRVEGDQSGIG